MCIELDITLGMPIICSRNDVNQELKVKNGSLGYIVGIQFSQANTHYTTSTAYNVVEIRTYKVPPEIVFVKLFDSEHVYIDGLPPGVIPILYCNSSKPIEVILPNRSFKLKICQFLFAAGFAITVEKCQGLTLDTMIIGDMLHPTRMSPQVTSLYVALSRIRNVDNLRSLMKFERRWMSYFKPNKLLLDVIEKLRQIELQNS